MTGRNWRVGVDIGGTFTDVVAVEAASGATRTAKVRTRQDSPTASLRAAIDALDLGFDDVDTIVHGTTLVTNAIVEDRLAPVALVATEGFADILEIGRQNRRALYSLALPPKLAPLVPQARRFEVRERIGPDGAVRTPLDHDDLARVADAIRGAGVESVAVSLLHAYANPAHETIVGGTLADVAPFVSLSHIVNPEEREYERTSATVLNAALMPIACKHLDDLGRALPKGGRLHLFHSAGGMASTSTVRERPLVLALSGPAAGVSAARQVAREMALDNVLTLDMGGTTTDVCLIRDGRPEIRREATLADRPLRQPMVAVHSIGAGGGSIAHVVAGMLRVGPQSAGAMPGPACYGSGGMAATVTDANLALGYLDHTKPLADNVRVDAALARRAIDVVGRELGMTTIETALGIVRVANANMLRALRNVTIDRGVDGRRCTLVAFGGAGPMHAAALARAFGIAKVVVPAYSSAYSALGCAAARASHTQQRTLRMASRAWSDERLADARDALLREMALDRDEHEIDDVALVRYAGQSYSVEVPYDFPVDVDTLARNFRAMHAQLYGFATDEPWEIESIRATATSCTKPPDARPPRSSNRGRASSASISRCWFDASEPIETPRYRRDALPPDAHIDGPAIVEDAWSTVLVPPGAKLACTEGGHLELTLATLQ